ncbi:hypothetical protein MIS45_00245 [Wielerella bovis]|uniref:hypothetical protein n=1 Tax=Wielerella bovis TaxID=2917790 RepID=UPI002019C76A|nr:hypothetical protein [Wielerella bovis]ULJ69352.1 hypothetical protein MIS45_00245 [Wielerella bovis]
MTAQNDEIQKIMVSVFELTGCKMTADDPIIAMMLIQRREMAELVAQHQEQQQFFLDELTKKANAIVGSADAFEQQKKFVLQEILHTNAQELAQAESKMFAQISQRAQNQFDEMSADLFKNLETRTFRLMMILLVVQVGVLIASLIL